MYVNGLSVHAHQVGQDGDVHDGNVDEAVLPREASPRLNQKENHVKMNRSKFLVETKLKLEQTTGRQGTKHAAAQ